MTYTPVYPGGWKNSPDKSTPITAAALDAMDAGIKAAQSGVTVLVPPPTGKTATDTPAVTAAITSLKNALAFGPATLQFQDGTYQIDSNSAVIQGVSNFKVRGFGGTSITQAPNRASLPNNTAGNILTIADCTDFRVEGLTVDGMRDTVAPLTPLTASAASGQASVTVAAGQGTRYQVGQYLTVFGGIGSSEHNLTDGFNAAGTSPRVVASITPGGGANGGDLITFTTNLVNSYTVVNGALLNDPYGPYGCSGAFVTPYSCGYGVSLAGRTNLGSEDQQNGLHLMGCKRFSVSGVTARNTWLSPIKLGCGIAPSNATYANSCYDGIVENCIGYHAYDQGVSVWICQHITVGNCWMDSVGWGGVVLTESDYCTVTGNVLKNIIYQDSAQAGGGVVVEGGIKNTIDGNVITAPFNSSAWAGISVQGWPSNGTWGLPSANSNWPTLTAYLAAPVNAGTSVAVSSTSSLMVGGRYSIFDGYRTESVTVASIVDSTHVTFAETLRFAHASGLYMCPRFSQENVVSGNIIDLSGAESGANGIYLQGSVRTVVTGNEVSNWTNNGILMNALAQFCPPGSYNGGDGASISGNILAGGLNYGIAVTQVSRLLIKGNQVYGSSGGSQRGINLIGCTDSSVIGNRVTDIASADAIRCSTGGPSSVTCARLIIEGNVLNRANGSGLMVIGGDSLAIRGNICSSNTLWGIQIEGVTNSSVDGNICNSSKSGGISLANNGTTGCTSVRVVNNTCREDGSGVNITNGTTFTQPWGINESGASGGNLYAFNELDGNSNSAQISIAGTGTLSTQTRNIVSGTIQTT